MASGVSQRLVLPPPLLWPPARPGLRRVPGPAPRAPPPSEEETGYSLKFSREFVDLRADLDLLALPLAAGPVLAILDGPLGDEVADEPRVSALRAGAHACVPQGVLENFDYREYVWRCVGLGLSDPSDIFGRLMDEFEGEEDLPDEEAHIIIEGLKLASSELVAAGLVLWSGVPGVGEWTPAPGSEGLDSRGNRRQG